MLIFTCLSIFVISIIYMLHVLKKKKSNDNNNIKKNKNNKLPPSPSKLSILGNIHHLIGKKLPLHETFAAISEELGPVFTFWFGDAPVIVINDYFIAKKVLLSTKCHGRPQRNAGRVVSKNFKGIIVTDACPAMKQRSNVLRRALTTHGRNNFEHNLQNESKHLIHSISTKLQCSANSICDITQELSLASYNMVMKLIFNKRLTSCKDETFCKLQQLLQWLLEGLTLANIMQGFPMIRRIPLGRFLFLDLYEKGIFELIGKEYDEHIENFENNNLKDLTDILLCEHAQLSRDTIDVLLADMLVAGLDTTTNSFKLVVLNLIHRKKEALKCQEEIQKVLGDRNLTLDDINEFHYVHAFVSESLRKNTTVPLGVPHKTVVDMEIMEYTVPKDTTVFINIDCIHKDYNLHDQPDVFLPERFLDDTGKYKHINGFLPFAVGRRECLGKNHAMKTIIYYVVELLKNFDLDTPEGITFPEKFTFSTTINILPFNIKLQKRQHDDNNNNKNRNNNKQTYTATKSNNKHPIKTSNNDDKINNECDKSIESQTA